MLPFAAIGAGVGMLGGISKMIGGSKRKKDSINALKKLQKGRQTFRNIYEGQRISTRGAEYAREGIQGTQATSVDALRSGGVRGVVGGMQGVQESANSALQREAAQLDQQQVALDRATAADEARIQSMNEQRQIRDEAQAQAAINAAQQDINSGIGDIAGSAFGAAMLGAGGGKKPLETVTTSSQLSPVFTAMSAFGGQGDPMAFTGALTSNPNQGFSEGKVSNPFTYGRTTI